jgi:hypothetical protein
MTSTIRISSWLNVYLIKYKYKYITAFHKEVSYLTKSDQNEVHMPVLM